MCIVSQLKQLEPNVSQVIMPMGSFFIIHIILSVHLRKILIYYLNVIEYYWNYKSYITQ